MKSFLTALLLCSVSLAIVTVDLVRADNWPNWRGPQYNGVAAGKNYPTTWGKTENVLWKVALPGPGASTPVVWGDRIFLTCGVNGDNMAVALDKSGKVVWQTPVGKERIGKNAKATGSNSSAVSDGKHVYVYFKSGDLACLDFDGNVVWHKNLQAIYGEDTLWWDLGTSPVLTKDHVIIAVMQTGPSYVAAFDKNSGDKAWKVDRNLDAPEEAAQSYSTPLVLEEGGRQIIVILGADHVTAHEAADGKEIWRVSGLNPTNHKYFRSIASPVAADGIVVAPYARGASLTAIHLGGSGDVTKTQIAWNKEGLGTDVPTPATSDGKFYLLTDKGVLNCLDLQSGKSLWSRELEKNRHAYSSCPIVADGKIYCTREDGKTFVVEQGDEGKLLAANDLDDNNETVVATPVLTDGRILIRSRNHLYCIGK